MKTNFNGKSRRRWLAGIALALAALAAAGCGEKFKDRKIIREVGSPKIGFQEPVLATLGRLDGPYVFLKCDTPTQIQLADKNSKTQIFRLMGLSDDPYPEPPPPPPKNPNETPIPPEDPGIKAKRLEDIKNFKMQGIAALCEGKQLWVLRLTRDNPAMIYLFIPDSMILGGRPATGEATLVNGLAVRKGLANMDLMTPIMASQPLYGMMLDSQLACTIEAKNKKTDGNELWTKYKMQLPPGPYIHRLEELEKTM